MGCGLPAESQKSESHQPLPIGLLGDTPSLLSPSHQPVPMLCQGTSSTGVWPNPTGKGSGKGTTGPQFLGITRGQEAPRAADPAAPLLRCPAQRLISFPHQRHPFPREGSGPSVSERQNQAGTQSLSAGVRLATLPPHDLLNKPHLLSFSQGWAHKPPPASTRTLSLRPPFLQLQ